jgi:hypothetical protein
MVVHSVPILGSAHPWKRLFPTNGIVCHNMYQWTRSPQSCHFERTAVVGCLNEGVPVEIPTLGWGK